MEYDAYKIGERLKIARHNSGQNVRELADKLGVNASTISRYENGEVLKIKIPMLYELSKILAVDPMWILGMTDTMESKQKARPSKLVPLLGTISAGIPIFAEENVEEWYSVDDRLHIDFALLVKGDSMTNANIFNGDIALIRRQPNVDNGEIAAVLIEDEATLKRVYINPDGVILQAANEKYPPIILKEGNVKVLGKLVGVYSNRE